MTVGVPVPNGWQIYYNGYDFLVETEPVNVASRPVYDAAGRTVIYVVHTMRFRTTVTSLNRTAGTTDVTGTSTKIGEIRRQLMQPAGKLVLTGLGWFDQTFNDSSGTGNYDVVWGPRPRELSWQQAGSEDAWKMDWQLEVATPDQCAGNRRQGVPMAFNYKVAYERDRSGYSTRTYSGYLEIPQTRKTQGSRQLTDNADRYLESALPPTLPGFRRETKTCTINESKCKIDFSVQDTELKGYAPPPDCVISDVRVRAQARGIILLEWFKTLSGRYEMAKGVPKSRAWARFFDLVQAHARNSIRTLRGKKGAPFIPTGMTIDGGNLHDAEAGSFSFSYRFILPKGQLDLMQQTAAIWMVPPGSNDPAAWQQSMDRQNVTTPRGYAQLKFDNSDDRIVDLCGPANPVPTIVVNGAPRRIIDVLAAGDDREDRADVGNPLNLTKPSPDQSWLEYDLKIVLFQRDNVAVHQPLPTQPVVYNPPTGDVDSQRGFTTGFPNTPPIIQQRTAPLLYAVLIGRAQRAGYKITPPNLTSIGGVACWPCNDGTLPTYSAEIVANMGIPVEEATWMRRYVLAGVPQVEVNPPDNRILGNVVDDDRLDGFVVPG